MTEKIWDQFKEELLGFINSKVRNIDVAEDILQEVFVKIHLKISSVTDKDKLSSWIYQLSRNTIIDYFRKNKKESDLTELNLNYEEDQKVHNNEMLRCLMPFIKNLPSKYQEVLLETTYGSMSQKEYAEKYDLNYSAVKSRIQRARKQLKELFLNCCEIQSDIYGNVLDIAKKNNCKCD